MQSVNCMSLKIVVSEKVIHGFGRGSKKLQCPTANIQINGKVEEILRGVQDGVYMGFSKFKNTKISTKLWKSVISIGKSPHFNDQESRTFECHLIGFEEEDFYGEVLCVEVVKFMRKMKKYKSLEDLKGDIFSDISTAKKELDEFLKKK